MAGNPVVTGTTVSSTWANNTFNDVATGLSTAICKDGQQTVTANIPFAGFRLTGIGAATALTDAMRADQSQNNGMTTLSSVAGTNTITGAATPTPSAYVAGQVFRFVPANTNTAATTLNVSSLGAGAVQVGGAACVGGEIVQNVPVEVFVTTSTPVFQVMNPQKARLTNSLGGDVALNNTGNYFTGPTVAQGTVGTWFASGTISAIDTAGAAEINVKLWDGTTVIASARARVGAAGATVAVSLSGYISSPAGNIRIDANDSTSTSGAILYNASGNSKDSTLSVIRIG